MLQKYVGIKTNKIDVRKDVENKINRVEKRVELNMQNLDGIAKPNENIQRLKTIQEKIFSDHFCFVYFIFTENDVILMA